MQEEIIIDGVDVAGCEFAVKPKNDNRIKCHCAKGLLQIAKMQEQPESIKSGLCENNPDCYYKQLKRAENTVNECHKYQAELEDKIDHLEQENKELKEKIIELSEEKGHLIVENNTLKESNQSLSILGTDLASANETVRKEFFRADKNKDMWREKAEKYRSALEEIREIANDAYYNEEEYQATDVYKEIADNIDEVLGC